MAFQAVPNGIEVAVHATQDGQELVNLFGYVSTNPTPTDLDLLFAIDQVDAFLVNYYKSLVSSRCHFYSIVATDVSSVAGHQFTSAVDHTGLVTASQPVPLSVAAVITIKPGSTRGRGSRGRNFAFGLTEADVDGDQLVTVNDWFAAWNTLLTSFAPTEGHPVFAVLSRKHHIAHIATEVIARPYLAVQKDRLPNHRRRRHAI